MVVAIDGTEALENEIEDKLDLEGRGEEDEVGKGVLVLVSVGRVVDREVDADVDVDTDSGVATLLS